jgi:hypothetical protein
MNHKRRKPLEMEDQNMEMSSAGDITDTAKDTIAKMGQTVNSNKLLIGSIAVGCGAAIFLIATDSGKRVRTQIKDRALDLYDDVSEQAVHQWNRLRDVVQDMLSEKSSEQVSEDLRHVA